MSEPYISSELVVYGFIALLIAVGVCGAIAIVHDWWRR